jgi:hypothetical protein
MLILDLAMLKFDVGHRAGYWCTGIRGAGSGVATGLLAADVWRAANEDGDIAGNPAAQREIV